MRQGAWRPALQPPRILRVPAACGTAGRTPRGQESRRPAAAAVGTRGPGAQMLKARPCHLPEPRPLGCEGTMTLTVPEPRCHERPQEKCWFLVIGVGGGFCQDEARISHLQTPRPQTRGEVPLVRPGSRWPVRVGDGALCPLPPGQSPWRRPQALSLGAPSVSVGANPSLLFLGTETLTCNDAVFLQGLLPADLERGVQNLRETQVAHSARSWQ